MAKNYIVPLTRISRNSFLLFSVCFAASAFANTIVNLKVEVRMDGVRPEHDEIYLSTATRLPDDKTYFITAIDPMLSMDVGHHVVVRGCKTVEMGEKGKGKDMCTGTERFMYVWSHGVPKMELPKGVGFKVGKDSDIIYVLLEIHYGHAGHVNATTGDRSGVILWLTTEVKKEAGVFMLSTAGRLDPYKTENFQGACRYSDNITMYPFGLRPHTHARGIHGAAYKISNKTKKVELIGEGDPREPQIFYTTKNKNICIEKDDILAYRCVMKNTENRTIFIGPTTEDEMCNVYLMYYINGNIHPEDFCFSFGPPLYYWNTDRLLDGIDMPK